jgi:hypothetical protein
VTIAKVRGTIDVSGSPTQFFQADLSAQEVGLEDDMAAALVGDGNARIAVSLDMADKNFGRGFSAHVTVSLNTNQDEATIRQTHAIATALAEEFLADTFDVAKNMAQALLTPQRD